MLFFIRPVRIYRPLACITAEKSADFYSKFVGFM